MQLPSQRVELWYEVHFIRLVRHHIRRRGFVRCLDLLQRLLLLRSAEGRRGCDCGGDNGGRFHPPRLLWLGRSQKKVGGFVGFNAPSILGDAGLGFSKVQVEQRCGLQSQRLQRSIQRGDSPQMGLGRSVVPFGCRQHQRLAESNSLRSPRLRTDNGLSRENQSHLRLLRRSTRASETLPQRICWDSRCRSHQRNDFRSLLFDEIVRIRVGVRLQRERPVRHCIFKKLRVPSGLPNHGGMLRQYAFVLDTGGNSDVLPRIRHRDV